MQPNESLLEMVAQLLVERHGVKRGASSARKFVEQHRAIVLCLQASSSEKAIRKPATGPASDAFLGSYEWRRLRMQALKKYGARCQCCGASPETGAVMNVDHIKPRRLFPELALTLENLQVLCHECNHGKGNWDMTDWRGSVVLNE